MLKSPNLWGWKKFKNIFMFTFLPSPPPDPQCWVSLIWPCASGRGLGEGGMSSPQGWTPRLPPASDQSEPREIPQRHPVRALELAKSQSWRGMSCPGSPSRARLGLEPHGAPGEFMRACECKCPTGVHGPGKAMFTELLLYDWHCATYVLQGLSCVVLPIIPFE